VSAIIVVTRLWDGERGSFSERGRDWSNRALNPASCHKGTWGSSARRKESWEWCSTAAAYSVKVKNASRFTFARFHGKFTF
jgi:hypothetical protein